MLQLFESESHKWIKANKEKQEQAKEGMLIMEKQTEVEAPFSQMSPIQKPLTYKKEIGHQDNYPQLRVISQEGNYYITDDDEKIIETGKAETTNNKMYPFTKSKCKTVHFEAKDKMTVKKTDFGDGEYVQGDLERTKGGI